MTAKMIRLLDICFGAIFLILAAPIMLLTAVLIVIFDGTPIFYNQLRPGKNEKLFTLYKFRTMRAHCTKTSQNNREYITRLGAILRRFSLDELPQLINVIKGDMSLVGPRPLLVEYLPLYNKEQRRRHEVKPGITGWAQVNGRNSSSWRSRFIHDVWYVDNHTVSLYLKIVVLTFIVVAIGKDVYKSDGMTMEPFRGEISE